MDFEHLGKTYQIDELNDIKNILDTNFIDLLTDLYCDISQLYKVDLKIVGGDVIKNRITPSQKYFPLEKSDFNINSEVKKYNDSLDISIKNIINTDCNKNNQQNTKNKVSNQSQYQNQISNQQNTKNKVGNQSQYKLSTEQNNSNKRNLIKEGENNSAQAKSNNNKNQNNSI